MAHLMSLDWRFRHDGEQYEILVWLVNDSQGIYELEVRQLTPNGSVTHGTRTVTTGWANAFADKNNPILGHELSRLERLIREEF